MPAYVANFPTQQLPASKKTDEWRKQCVDWADTRASSRQSIVRKSLKHKRINYDLLSGKLHMDDLVRVVDPNKMLSEGDIPDAIQHFPIMANKVHLLVGEEAKRIYDYHVVVTNPTAISEIERNKKKEIAKKYEEFLAGAQQNQSQDQAELDAINDYLSFQWQDIREKRANCLLKHYEKEQNFNMIFNKGFEDALCVGEEVYQCSIEAGRPVLRKLNPMKLSVYMSGFSNNIEDADIIVYEDYVSPGAVLDAYYDALNEKDVEKLEKGEFGRMVDELGNYDPRAEFTLIGEDAIMMSGSAGILSLDGADSPMDEFGNVRVVKVYWKSRRKIMKVRSFDPITGEETFDFYPESHKIDENLGESAETFWINEAWEGTKVADDIYVNIRPCQVQYNRMTNPSLCHFGIIGSVYNINEGKPFSLVDMMKPYNYFYDVIHDRLNKAIARNFGKMVRFDISTIPDGWTPDKWLHFAKVDGLYVVDSFKEGNKGAATGKLAGALNNNTTGVVDAEIGQVILSDIQLLKFINEEMSQVIGVSPQREGSISNRETVGGVERATVQSAHITEWLFLQHDNVKKRVMECFLETAKIAMRGLSEKMRYITDDGAVDLLDFDGDEFAECDYGLVVDSSDGTQKLNQQLETLMQAGMQSGAVSISTAMKLYGSASMSEKVRMVEKAERDLKSMAQQQQQQQMELAQQQQQAQMELTQMQQQFQIQLKQMECDNRIKTAQIQAQSKWENTMIDKQDSGQFAAEMDEKQREWDEKMELEHAKLKQKTESEEANRQLQRSEGASNRAATAQEGSEGRKYDYSKTVMQESNKIEMAKQKAAEAKSKAKATKTNIKK